MTTETSRRSVYLASPLGFAESTSAYLELAVTTLAGWGLQVVDPWSSPESQAAKDEIQAAESVPDLHQRRSTLRAANRRIAGANERAIRETDFLIAVLDGPDVDSGTAAEVGFAAALGHRVYGLRTDWRRGLENDGALVNLQLQWWIEESGGAIVTSLDDLGRILSADGLVE